SSAPPGWPGRSVNGQVYQYGMNSGVVNNSNPAIGGVQQTKDALVSIPTLSIVLDQASLTSSRTGIYSNPNSSGYAWEREASLELIHPPGWIDPDGNLEGFQTGCGLRIRGGFSRRTQNPKHSFRLFFRREYGNGRLNYKLFGDEGADEFDKIDLRGPQNYSWAMGGTSQNSFVRDTWSRDLQGEMGHPYKRSRWYHLYLNGIYWGMCETDERAEANYGEIYFGGDQLDYDVVKSFGGVTDGNRSSYQRLWQKWQSGFSSNAAYFNIQGRNSNGSPNPAIEKLVDLENLIDYMIITYYTGDRDGPGSRYTQPRPNNYFGVYNRLAPDGYKFFEHDSEHSLGTGENNMVSPFTRSSSLNDFNPHTLHERLAGQNLEYRMLFADHVAKYCYNGGLLTDAIGIARVNRRADFIDQAIFAHSARWGSTSRSHASWLNAVQSVRNFITGRVPTMIGQLRSVGWYPDLDSPGYSQHGGSIASNQQLLMEGGPGVIYYTINGEDPRQLGGAITPGAQVFQGNTTTENLVSTGSTWKYLDNGSNQGTAWRNPGFNDNSWESGAAELGYGDDDEATTLSFGPSSNAKYATTYFRHSFNATNVDDYTKLTLGLRRDDGAVVYLNGNEVARSNMPNGTITYLTTSSTFVSGADERAYFPIDIPPVDLLNGQNTLAVEIHQYSGTSSDISFDLQLDGLKTTTANPLFLTTAGTNIVQSRVRNGTQWSALTEATFVVDTDPAAATLALTEIHYRPAPPSAAEVIAGFNGSSDFEFVELLNFGPRHIDLGGLAFTSGIGFTFDESLLGRTMASGHRIVLVNNLAAFEMRYGIGHPVAGEFSGDLNNDGERLIITDSNGAVVLDLTYNDADPWPISADGDGYSLVLINPESQPDLNDPASWRTSASGHGNPGG
ncbi:MAG: CotH kinase family protein, partial [Roseibacillus sp.]|nr:CotH kinase family protein [Roseibacillus sp.]